MELLSNILTYCIECLYGFFVVFCTLGFISVVCKREASRSIYKPQEEPSEYTVTIPIFSAPSTSSNPVIEAKNGIRKPRFNRNQDGILQSIIIPLADLTILQLRKLASNDGLANYSRLDKPQLISYLETRVAPEFSQTAKATGFAKKKAKAK